MLLRNAGIALCILIIILGTSLAVIGIKGMYVKKYADFQIVRGVVSEVEPYTDDMGRELERVKIDYVVDGKNYSFEALNGQKDAHKAGDEADVKYKVSDPTDAWETFDAYGIPDYAYIIAGAFLTVLGIVLVIPKKKKAEETPTDAE